jgi:hypothetical protein
LGNSTPLFCQSTWIKKIDLDRIDTPNGLINGDTGNFYLTHRYENGSLGPVTQNLTKMSGSGNEIWNLKFKNYPYHVFEGPAAILSNNDLIVSFLFEDSINLAYQIFRINPDGDILWTVSLPFLIHQKIDYAFQLYKVFPISPNDIRLFFRMNYYWESDPPSAKNGYISLDSLGQERYREYFDTNGEYQWPYKILQTQDSHFIKVYRPTLGQIELILRYDLLDKDYNQDWSFEIGPQDGGGGGPVCTDAGGNIYFTWNHDTTGNGNTTNQLSSIISLNQHGEFRWITPFGEDKGLHIFYDIISMSDGRIIACGQEGNNILSGGNYRTGWIACIDTSGNKLWERRYILEDTRDAGNNFNYLIESDDGGITLFGGTTNTEDGYDVYILKTDYYGCLSEDCGLYNFISFTTDTKDIVDSDSNDSFYYYLNESTLTLVSKFSLFPKELQYELILLNGIVMAKGKVNDINTQIDISGFIPGLYLIRIFNQSGKTHSFLKFFNPG